MRTRMALVLAVLVAVSPLPAAEPEPLRPGQRVRIETAPPPGTDRAGGGHAIPGRPVGRDREGITQVREAGPVTFAAPGRRLEGEVVAFDGEHLRLKLRGWDEPVTVRREAITRLEVRHGGRSRGTAGALGAVVGGAVGALVGLGAGDDDPGLVAFSAGDKAAMLGILGAGTGLLIGLVAGGGDRWESVDPGGVRVSIGPARGGVAAALEIGF